MMSNVRPSARTYANVTCRPSILHAFRDFDHTASGVANISRRTTSRGSPIGAMRVKFACCRALASDTRAGAVTLRITSGTRAGILGPIPTACSAATYRSCTLCTSAGERAVSNRAATIAAPEAIAIRARGMCRDGSSRRALMRRRIAMRSTAGIVDFIRLLRTSAWTRASSNIGAGLQTRRGGLIDDAERRAQGAPGQHQVKPDRRRRRAEHDCNLAAVQAGVVAQHDRRALRPRQFRYGSEDIQSLVIARHRLQFSR